MPRNKSLLKGGHTSRKIVIRPYSKPPTLPENYYDDTVRSLLQSISEASSHRTFTGTAPSPNSTGVSLQNAYKAVVYLVSHQYGPRLYRDLMDHMKQVAARILPEEREASASRASLLMYIPKQYQLYLEYLLLCKHVFLPLDRTHAWQPETKTVVVASTQTPGGLLTLWQVGLEMLQTRMQELTLDRELYQEWLAALLQDWNPASNNNLDAANRQDLQSVWYLWQDLGQLAILPLQEDLEEYWKNQSQQMMEGYRAGSYLQFAYDKHVHVTIWQPWLPSQWLRSVLENCFFQPHLNDQYLLKPENLHPILQSELFAIKTVVGVSSTAMEKLSSTQQLWTLAGRIVGGQRLVATSIAKFAKTQGLACVQPAVELSDGAGKAAAGQHILDKSPIPATNNVQIVSDLLDTQQRISRLIQSLPHGPELIILKNVWEEVLNVETTPALAELLAKFLDQILRSNKKMDQYQSESEQWLQRIISGLFIPLQAKDIFEAFYKRDLAKRLLWNRVVNMDVEKQVCSLLKAECGAGFTSKMEGMFQDVDWSRETMMVYKQSTADILPTENSVEMEAQVLTTGYWPVYPQYPNLHLPESLKEPQERFGNHYKIKYQGRRMTWQYALGHCVVRSSGFPKTYEFVVSLCQALVLIQFEEADTKLSLPTLMQAIGLEDRDEMERVLQSLALGKDGTRILRKLDYDSEPNKKKKIRMNVDNRDEFTINRKFESNQRRIRINNIMMKESKEEREKTVEAVSRDRLYLIDAVLVRIMKARKTILHQTLIPQVVEQVKVPAQPGDIKQRIESLIEREYMERDAKDRNRYNYLA
jgi:hypothetical protein